MTSASARAPTCQLEHRGPQIEMTDLACALRPQLGLTGLSQPRIRRTAHPLLTLARRRFGQVEPTRNAVLPGHHAAGPLPGWQVLRRSGANFTADTTNDETEGGLVRRFSPAPRASHLPRWWSLLRAGCASCVPQLPPARGPCECDTAPWVPIRSQGGSHLTGPETYA